MGDKAIATLFYTTRSKVMDAEGKASYVSNSNYNPITLEDRADGHKATGFLSARRLTNHHFEQFTDDNYYLLWDGYRIPQKGDDKLPYHFGKSIYKEELNLNTPFGSIHATSAYPDAGEGQESSISNSLFAVIGATGVFSEATSIVVEYSNDGSMPWARDAKGESVPAARRMTVMGPRGGSSSNAGPSKRKLIM